MKANFNDEQISIINEGIDHNILVSAAAGSGKTTVLVERIVRKLLGENCNNENISLSNILIMTFTKKATAEMKKRIKSALDQVLVENPNNKKLIRESAIMQNANISTIDSFCMRLFEENYASLDEKNSLYHGVDNDCKIVDDKELSILREEVLNILLEEEYSNDKYKNLFDAYTEKTSEAKLRAILDAGIVFLNSIAWPIDYIDRHIKYFDEYSLNAYDEYLKSLGIKIHTMRRAAMSCETKVSEFKSINEDFLEENTDKKKGNKSLDDAKIVISGLETIIKFLKLFDKEEYLEVINDGKKTSYEINTVKFKGLYDLAKEIVKLKMPFVRANILSIDTNENKKYKDIITKDIAEIAQIIVDAYEYLNIDKKFLINKNEKLYLELLRTYYINIVAEKKKRNMFEIGDYAKMALDVLYDREIDKNGDAVRVVSDVAKALSDKYKLIFIDEYQDTSELQEYLLKALSDNFKKNNVFMVGDVKQSIYEFRDAEPQIFVDKYNEFENNKDAGIVKVLTTNYRSTKEIISYVNDLFGKVMTPEYGEIDYSDRHSLNVRDDEREKKTLDATKVEIKVVCKDEIDEEADETEDSKAQKPKKEIKAIDYEAEYVARKIYNLVEVEKTCEYKDIVILLRTAKDKTERFADAFNKYKVPYYAEEKKGFFGKLEIKLMIDILNIIYNPLQNIPLVSVLESSMFKFTNEEIAVIKLLYDLKTEKEEEISKEDVDKTDFKKRKKQYMFYDAISHVKNLLDYDVNKESGEIISDDILNESNKRLAKYSIDIESFKDRVNNFFEKFESLEFASRYLSISSLIEKIYEDLNVKNIMSAMRDGRQRMANLNMLYNFAIAYENSSYVGLFNFLRYIEKITETNGDKGQARILDENANVVRMMTIHTSKGLQFKTIFMCDCNKAYNVMDANENSLALFNKKYGVALDYYDFEDRYKIVTPKKKYFARDKLDHINLEEIRMLYVALTRPESKLYIVGHTSSKGFKQSDLDEFLEAKSNNKNVDKDIRDCKSFFDLILSNYPIDNEELCSFEVVPIKIADCDDVVEDDFDLEDLKKISKEELDELKKSDANFEKYDAGVIKGDLEDSYVYRDLQKLNPKFSVSSIKNEHKENINKESIQKENSAILSIDDIPSLADEDYDTKVLDKKNDNKDVVDGRDIGNAYHRYMQFYNYNEMKYDNNSSAFDIENLNAIVNATKIDSFVKSNIGKRMAAAYNNKSLYREYKFMKLLSQNDVNKYIYENDKDIKKYDNMVMNDEDIVIQGIIDAFFVERDENNNEYIVLVDYKTDSISKSNVKKESLRKDLIDNYKIQLDIYANVIEQNTGYEVKEKYIYSFALDEEIKL